MLHDTRALQLVQHEQFDLHLYQRFVRRVKSDELKAILTTMIAEEERHIAIWKRYVPHTHIPHRGVFARFKMAVLLFCGYIFGDTGIRIIIEAIEVHGIREYLLLAHEVSGTPLEEPLDEILHDELEHEAQIVGDAYTSEITSERIRSFLLGFNDGLVEMLGAVVGFYATISNPALMVFAGISVISAGSFSMAAGAYAAGRAEYELDKIREAKKRFLATGHPTVDLNGSSGMVGNSIIVGCSFIIGGVFPPPPPFFFRHNLFLFFFFASVFAAALGVIVVSVVLAFLTGISIRKRIALNLGLITAAVLFAAAIGSVIEWLIA